MGDERRQHARFSVNQCVTLSFAHEDFIDATGMNLSYGGLLFRSTATIDLYQKIFVMIDVPQGTVKAEGIVVRVEQNSPASVYGLKFTDVASEYRSILEAYCAESGSQDVPIV